MKKIPTLFVRDHTTGLVSNSVTPGCDWVIAGKGVATRKWDGTCCLVRDGKLYKRYDVKRGKTPPEGFEPAQEPDEITGHWPGWLAVTHAPEDRWHREGWDVTSRAVDVEDGTYELVGPKIGGNPEGLLYHTLVRHGIHPYPDAPRTFDALREFLTVLNAEGLVWHRPDGRMCKLKLRDFGLKRT